MQQPKIRQLPATYRPLLNKFYRAHRSHMRAPAGADYWVAGQPDIVAALCLADVADGKWLTGLLVAPDHRGRGLARYLVSRTLAAYRGSVWLFCEPKLATFYQRLGFRPAEKLPEPLASRLERYNRHKTLTAMHYHNELMPKVLKIATACLLDEAGRLLIVRKRGTHMFMLPGGKNEPGESPLATLVRELQEELDLEVEPTAFQPLGHFQSRAANEPDHWVEADVFVGSLHSSVKAQAEIEELAWLDLLAQHQCELAPLLREQIIPTLLKQMVDQH